MFITNLFQFLLKVYKKGKKCIKLYQFNTLFGPVHL